MACRFPISRTKKVTIVANGFIRHRVMVQIVIFVTWYCNGVFDLQMNLALRSKIMGLNLHRNEERLGWGEFIWIWGPNPLVWSRKWKRNTL